MAFGAGDIHVREELDIQAYRAGSVADRASEVPGVVREISCSVLLLFCIRGPGIELAKFVVDIGVGGYCGPDIDADRGGVNQFYPFYARGLYGLDMGWQFCPLGQGLQSGYQTLQYQGGLAAARYACYNSQASFWNIYFERFYCMYSSGG